LHYIGLSALKTAVDKGGLMTIGKAAALTAGLLGAMALGVIIGPSITNREMTTQPAAAVEPAPQASVTPAPAPVAPRVAAERRAEIKVRENLATMSSSSPELHARLKPVLNRGAKMELAAEGFRDAEQFATVAHAARNTDVPFMVLKHRVLNEKQSLSAAIAASKPNIDAKREAARARTAAREDLDAITN
jgi:hypothetical protein